MRPSGPLDGQERSRATQGQAECCGLEESFGDQADEFVNRGGEDNDGNHGEKSGDGETDESGFVDWNERHVADDGETGAEIGEGGSIRAAEDLFAGLAMAANPLVFKELIVMSDEAAKFEQGLLFDFDEDGDEGEKGKNEKRDSEGTVTNHQEFQGGKSSPFIGRPQRR